jgi:Ca2+-binding RTX toxin-like protein
MANRVGTNGQDIFNLVSDAAAEHGLQDDRVTAGAGFDAISTGAGNDFLDGGADFDTLSDGDGDDTVHGGAGGDVVNVDAGNDLYFGGSGTDWLNFQKIHYGPFGGEDNYNGIKLDLASTKAQDLGEFGIDQFFGFENVITGYGNDTIFGSADANFISNRGGSDLLDGREGNDTLIGGSDGDTLIGGLGKDSINAANGATDSFRDVVRYESLKDSGTTGATWDEIFQFTKGQDKIDLSKIDANLGLKGNQAFKVVKGFTKAFGEVKLVKSGTDTIVQVDGDKDSAIDMTFWVYGVHLSKSDFIL